MQDQVDQVETIYMFGVIKTNVITFLILPLALALVWLILGYF